MVQESSGMERASLRAGVFAAESIRRMKLYDEGALQGAQNQSGRLLRGAWTDSPPILASLHACGVHCGAKVGLTTELRENAADHTGAYDAI